MDTWVERLLITQGALYFALLIYPKQDWTDGKYIVVMLGLGVLFCITFAIWIYS